MAPDAVVYIVDDEPAIRSALTRALRQAGLRSKAYAGAEAFLSELDQQAPGCLLLDIRMPGMDGITLQQTLLESHITLPVIFLTGSGTIPMAVAALQAGAVDFLEKPFDNEQLVERVQHALALDARLREVAQQHAVHAQKLARLTRREREVMDLLVASKSNKAIAQRLNISSRTVETHRENLFTKLDIQSLPELVQVALSAPPSDN